MTDPAKQCSLDTLPGPVPAGTDHVCLSGYYWTVWSRYCYIYNWPAHLLFKQTINILCTSQTETFFVSSNFVVGIWLGNLIDWKCFCKNNQAGAHSHPAVLYPSCSDCSNWICISYCILALHVSMFRKDHCLVWIVFKTYKDSWRYQLKWILCYLVQIHIQQSFPLQN